MSLSPTTQAPYLLKFQIGPVQEFIAAARSTRDLWSGSYLLSWLISKGIKSLMEQGGTIIYPETNSQPLLQENLETSKANRQAALIPNLPNLFIAKIQNPPSEVARKACAAIEEEWKRIAQRVWDLAIKHRILQSEQFERFFAAVEKHLSITWASTQYLDDRYDETYRKNGWYLDAVRQTRNFHAWSEGKFHSCVEKDSLTGKDQALCGGKQLSQSLRDSRLAHLFKHEDYLGAITLIKRLWHEAYLLDSGTNPFKRDDFQIRSIPEIANYLNSKNDDEIEEDSESQSYIAAIAFDGDQIGKWMNASEIQVDESLEDHHCAVSGRLSRFAIHRVKQIFEQPANHYLPNGSSKIPSSVPIGQLIYSGGDDVLALVPAREAIQIAEEIRRAFREEMGAIQGTAEGKRVTPDGSAGIAIAHVKFPLQDLIQEAKSAEKDAKNKHGRQAFSISLLKRSGEISFWGSKWDSLAIPLYQLLSDYVDQRKLSKSFLYLVISLLEKYGAKSEGYISQSRESSIDDVQTMIELIDVEISHALSRQSRTFTHGITSRESAMIQGKITDYLKELATHTCVDSNQDQSVKHAVMFQRLVDSVISLFTTVAFSSRI